jgi:hypothetical protein
LLYPNLLWAIDERRLAHYEFCALMGMDPTRFSRCLHGRFAFKTEERHEIARYFDYPVDWLFQTPAPPFQSLSQADTARPTTHTGVQVV